MNAHSRRVQYADPLSVADPAAGRGLGRRLHDGLRRVAYAVALVIFVGSLWAYARVAQAPSVEAMGTDGTVVTHAALREMWPSGAIARMAWPSR